MAFIAFIGSLAFMAFIAFMAAVAAFFMGVADFGGMLGASAPSK